MKRHIRPRYYKYSGAGKSPWSNENEKLVENYDCGNFFNHPDLEGLVQP